MKVEPKKKYISIGIWQEVVWKKWNDTLNIMFKMKHKKKTKEKSERMCVKDCAFTRRFNIDDSVYEAILNVHYPDVLFEYPLQW